MSERPSLLVEPFAGGGIISLTAVCEDLVDEALMVELDEDVAAVWQAVVDGDAPWLADRIIHFDLTKEAVIGEISRTPRTTRERAFQTILKNRTFHGGILAEGAGFLKHGENGKGIRSRWYPETLARRLQAIHSIARKIHFKHADGFSVLAAHKGFSNQIFFIDPPYTAGGKKAGRRLYRLCELDHNRLFSLCEQLAGDFLLTYDNAEEVRALARRYGFQMRLIPMTNTHHANMEELVIGKDLAWMDQFTAVHDPGTDYTPSSKTTTRLLRPRKKPLRRAHTSPA